ncbi:PucR family transcriptional regulator [Alkaliphilus serpentinus]|uniref:Purine catabolism regulatory protein n=1 Tax=Alkaliphilus serpentinus TaxID=1482731 RepID=A0A833HQM8_9FIRM|nr:PucR family transcriptional regulator [Alkaliphilus serpentinus]KAB3532089.1 hypothetical protein F8153_03200 [Alkaliphilus serpentinus]
MYRAFGITVDEMLSMEIMKDAKLLAGGSGSKKRVTKINVMEVPDIINWVDAGEFLLTTAYSIKDKPQVLLELLPEMEKKGLAGIGIKTKRYIDELPSSIIELANELAFPIIEIPFDVSYTDIMMPVLTEIIGNQSNILIKVHEIHNKLVDVMIKGGSLEKIAEGIANTIGNTVAIKENIFDNIVIASPNGRSEDYIGLVGADYNKNKTIATLETRNYKVSKDIVNDKEVNRIHYNILGENRNYGYLFVWEDNKKLSPIELTAIESSISIILLDLIKKISIFEIESRHKIEFLDDLLSKDEKRHKRALDRGPLFDFDSNFAYAVMIIKVINIRDLVKETFNNSTFLYDINSKILQIVERLSRNQGIKTLFGNKTDEIIILFGTDHEKKWMVSKNELMHFSQDILKQVAFQLKNTRIAIGLGRFYQTPAKLWRSHQEAIKAVSKSIVENNSNIQHYDDLGVYRVMGFDELEDEMQRFYKEILLPLVEYDEDKDSELVKTLNMYFKFGGNLKRISKEMYTHYNTIIYRVQRIKEITGMDLDDADDKLSLQMALKIYDVLKKT